MARTPTTSIPLGFQAPDFSIPEPLTDKVVTLNEVQGTHATLVMFICNHCPFVVHVMDELVRLGRDYTLPEVGMVAISSNDVMNYPQDAPDLMAELARLKSMPFPYLYDESQEVAKAYDAACTPDFSVFDAQGKCVYRGQLDGSRPGNDVPVTGVDIREVLDTLVSGGQVPREGQRPSLGCNIKWKENAI